MFKFAFDVESDGNEDKELLDDLTALEIGGTESRWKIEENVPEAVRTFTLEELVDDLGSSISFSFLSIPLAGIKLPRRELFDIRLQLVSGEQRKVLEYADDPSDLIPSVYEGGLKTWECSLDLAGYLHSHKVAASKVLELGAGSSIPSLYLFYRHLSQLPGDSQPLEIHLQDYNAPVLDLVILPNFILTWYFSSAAKIFRESETRSSSGDEDEDDQSIELTPELISSFRASLEEYHVKLVFVSGPWSSFPPNTADRRAPYDLILTSETIYNQSSHAALITALRQSSSYGHVTESQRETLILLSTKTIYFGLPPGGDVATFLKTLSSKDYYGSGTVVWSNDSQFGKGLGRQILQLAFRRP